MIFPSDEKTLNDFLMAQYENMLASVIDTDLGEDLFPSLFKELKDSFENLRELINGMQFLGERMTIRLARMEKRFDTLEKKVKELETIHKN
jgi:hypothetical protein